MLVDHNHVVTCAHVVEDVLGAAPGSGPPEGEIRVEFPLLPAVPSCQAVVVAEGWQPASEDSGDVAVLRLLTPIDGDEVVPAPLLKPYAVIGHGFSCRGFGGGTPTVRESHGTMRGTSGASGQWMQLDADTGSGLPVVQGYSGCPVWDTTVGAVIGIAVAQDKHVAAKVAHLIPVKQLSRAWPPLGDLVGWRMDLDEALDTHWSPRARGIEGSSVPTDPWLFTGRTCVLRELTTWLNSADPVDGRVRVVTGSPGAGKSAVLAHLVITSQRWLRDQVPSSQLAAGLVPDLGRVDVAVHARDKTVAAVVAEIARAAGVDMSTDVDLSSRLRIRREPFTMVVDALDEAIEPKQLALLLRSVAADPDKIGLRVLVGTRHGSHGPEGNLRRLGRPKVINLDEPPYLDEADLAAYAERLLAESYHAEPDSPNRNGPDRTELAAAIARRAAGNFLVAQLTCQGLLARDEPIDFADGWEGRFPDEVGTAFDEYLEYRYHDREPELRRLLTALAFAKGDGMPQGQILCSAIEALTGVRYQPADLEWMFESAASYLTERVGPNQIVCYRLFHDALDAHLRTRWRQDRRGLDADGLIFDALRRLVIAHDTLRPDWAGSDPYLHRNLAYHAAAADRLAELIEQPSFVVDADLPRLLPLLVPGTTAAESPIGTVLRQVGSRAASLPPDRRARLFALTAAHRGFRGLPQEFSSASSADFMPRWAHTIGPPHQELTEHAGPVAAVALGRLGKRHLLVSAGYDRTVRVWDETGRPVGEPLTGHTSEVVAVTIGRLGTSDVIVSADASGTMQIWDDAGLPLGEPLTGHAGTIAAVAVGSLGDRDVIVSAGYDRTIRIWDDAGQPIGKPLTGHSDVVHAVTVGRLGDEEVIVSAGYDRTVRIWNHKGQPLRPPLVGHTDVVLAVAVGHLGALDVIVSAGRDRVRAWDADGTTLVRPFSGHRDVVTALAIGQMNNRDVVVSASHDQSLRLWDAGGEPIGGPLTGHSGSVTAVAIGRLGGREVLASGGHDHTVRIWDEPGHPIGTPQIGHSDVVRALAVGRVGHKDAIVSAGYDRTVRIWDRDGHPFGRPMADHTALVNAIVVGRLAKCDTIAAANDDRTVHLWELGTHVDMALTGHLGSVTALALGKLGKRDVIVSVDAAGTLRIWDLERSKHSKEKARAAGKQLRLVVARRSVLSADPSLRLTAVALGRLGGRDVIISAGYDGVNRTGTMRIWDERGRSRGELPADHNGIVTALAVGELEGRDVLVSAHQDRTLRVWSRTGQPIEQLVGHTADVTAVALGRFGDRHLIVSASADQTLRIWRPGDANSVAVVDLLGNPSGVTIAASGESIYTASVTAICAFSCPPAS